MTVSRNKEHADLVRYLHQYGNVASLLQVFGVDAMAEIEKINIRYTVLDDSGAEAEARKAYESADDAVTALTKVRDEVGASWKGEAADLFYRYADKVVVAAKEERELLDRQHAAMLDLFADLEKIIKDAADALMDAIQGLLTLLTLPAGGAQGIAMALDRWWNGGEFPELAIVTDLAGVFTDVIAGAVKQMADLPAKFGEAGEGTANLRRFRSGDGGSLGSLALREARDFGIDPGRSSGRIVTGLEDDMIDDPHAWQAR